MHLQHNQYKFKSVRYRRTFVKFIFFDMAGIPLYLFKQVTIISFDVSSNYRCLNVTENKWQIAAKLFSFFKYI